MTPTGTQTERSLTTRSETTADDGASSAEQHLPKVRDESSPPVLAKPVYRSKPSLYDRVETVFSKLSTINNFWHRLCSFIWLPYAFRSGIKMKRIDAQTFTAVLPFKRFNRNWYNAMAGASLLANSEIAGGMYLFAHVGKDYTVVCKRLEYKFLRPCFGPAVYKVTPLQDVEELKASGTEFNIDVRLNIHQGLAVPGKGRERRVGRCEATFHVTPKLHHKDNALRGGDKALRGENKAPMRGEMTEKKVEAAEDAG